VKIVILQLIYKIKIYATIIMDLDFVKFKECQFEHLKTNIDKAQVFGQLKALENLALYIENMRESLTRLLVVNGIEDEDDYQEKVVDGHKTRAASP